MHSSHSKPKKLGIAVGDEPWWIRLILISTAYLLIALLILVPIVYVFVQAFSEGWSVYFDNLWNDPDTRHSIFLTMTIAPIAVVLNTVFGLTAAWAIARFRFPGRTLLITMLDVPFAISPVVVGLMFVLIFGMQGYVGPTLRAWGIQVIFAWPGLVLATTFVTLPFIARELIPLMEALGDEEEVAAISLGANVWQMFWRITLPNIKWGLLYGMIQCFSRAIGEFGAVYVVSGHIAGETDTMPLRVEKLFQEYNNPGSFAVASVLTMMALLTMIVKYFLERWIHLQQLNSRAEAILAEEGGVS